MKKILAVILVLAMLIPLGVTAQAEEVAVKPFYHVNISDSQVGYPHFYQMAYFWAPTNQYGPDDEPIVKYGGVSEIPQIAANLKEEFDKRPEGARYINFNPLCGGAFVNMNEEVLYMEKAIAYIHEWLYAFLEEYKSIGGKLDGVVLDQEYENAEYRYLNSRIYINDSLIYHKIVTHPMYQTKLRPLLEERGFKFFPNPTEYTPEIFGIHPNSGDEYAHSREIWDTATRILINEYTNEAVYKPVMEYYPDAIVTDYQSKNINAWDGTPWNYGGNNATGGNWVRVGNSSSDNTYNYRPSTNLFSNSSGPRYLSRTVPTYINALYGNNAYGHFLWDANVFKDMYGASDEGNISPWITQFLYNAENENSSSDTPYYTETVLHMGMLDPKPFLGYTTSAQYNGDQEGYEFSLEVIEDIMVELTRVVGYEDRKPIHIPANWNSSFVVSGMYANGRNVFRITPDTTQVSLENFKAEGTDPTFYVNGQTITFPGGKIIADGNIREVGTCGYWIETAKDVMPVITNAVNRYEEFPAYSVDFENLTAGAEMAYNDWQPEATWEVKKNKETTVTVKADPSDPNNNVLEINGSSYVLKNIQLPININSADSYAVHQAWEVELTLPADLSADAEIVLFSAYGQKTKTKDTGIVIKGGKVYYDKAGESVELTGVDLSAGGKITVKREMDFTDYKAVICDYSIYGADGTLLGEAKDVPVAEIEVPTQGIGMSFKNLSAPVLMDNYKLYITDVAADFTLYDAKIGYEVTEADKPRSEDTAYRLSWVNASPSEKIYQVIAAYYNGDALVSETVIEEVKMAPGTDSVSTGIVENKTEGQTLLVYLKDISPDDTGKNDTGKNPVGGGTLDMTLVIIAAIAVAIIIAGVAVILVVLLKNGKGSAVAAADDDEISAAEEAFEEVPATEEAPAMEEPPVTEESSETDAE